MLETLIGAGASLAGGLLGGSDAPKPKMYDITTGLGTADWSKKRGLNATLSPEQQAMADAYLQRAQGFLGGQTPTAGFQNWASGLGGMFPSLFQDALGASGVDPSALNAYTQNLGGLAGQMQGAFNGANLAGMNILGGAAPGTDMANAMFGAGQGLLGSSPQSYQDVYNQRLGLLREQAQPFEDRASNSFLSRQYAMGRMGSTGGGRDTEAFARGLSQADTTRQLDAMNLSEALYGRDLNAALSNRQIGAGLMGNGLQGLLSGFNSQTGAAQGLLGLGGNIGSLLGNLYGAGYGAQTGYNDMVNARAQQRMQNASTLFGFGNTLGQQDLANAGTMQGLNLNLYQALQQQGAMGTQMTGATMGAPAPTNTFQNAVGGLLSGFGQSVLANPGSLFGGGFNTYTSPGGTTSGLSPTQLQGAFTQLNNLPKIGS